MSYLSMDQVDFETMRSGGPGGQHSDRRATAVRLRIPIEDVPVDDDQKKDLKCHLPPRLTTKDSEILIENGDSRSQRENRKNALEQLNEEIEAALKRGRRKREKKRRKQRLENKSGGGGGSKDIDEVQKKRRRSESTDDLLQEAFEQDPDGMKRFIHNPPEDDGE
ncbi:MAG: peptide chain release factor-like protein [bacterium]